MIRYFRRAAPLLVALLIAQGCGGSSKTAHPNASSNGAPLRTLRFESQLLTIREVGAPSAATGARAADTLGSQLVFTGMLFRPGGTRAIGRSQGACTRTAPGAGVVFQCGLTFLFPNGSIFGQAVAATGGPASGVVSGGTGAYENMTGTFHYTGTGTPRIRLTFVLRS